ncbi:hypothetical protein [Halonatronum saccharophilum]|uniref:hypothetical protein n=1 Tax=Halonatronum saccharophilum TaxID=150060 RepID=UPI00055267AF|nr:hypothetical protein [Halonatronum saccharophilum]
MRYFVNIEQEEIAIEKIIEWLNNNKEWVFSGIGVGIITGLWTMFKRNKRSEDDSMNIDENSGIAVGKTEGDFNQTNNYGSATNINGDNNKVVKGNNIENQTNVENQNNITNNGGQQTNNFIQNQKDDPKKS